MAGLFWCPTPVVISVVVDQNLPGSPRCCVVLISMLHIEYQMLTVYHACLLDERTLLRIG